MHQKMDNIDAEHRWRPVDWDKAPVSLEKIESLTWRFDLYPRAHGQKGLDIRVAKRYARALQAGAHFPTVKVGLFNAKKILIDGMHRIKAHQLLHEEYVECSIQKFDYEADLYAEAVRLNSTHGKGFGSEDIRLNLRRLLKRYKMSVNDVVAICHLPAAMIERQVRTITSMTGPGGQKVYCRVKETNCNGKPKTREQQEFKEALILIRDVARKGCIPTEDPLFKQLIKQCRSALRKVHFDDKAR
jgi:hypothetical protein